MTDEDKKTLLKYLKYAIASGVAAGGIGVAARRIKDENARAKATSLDEHKNVITIPIRKDSFMEGLPTPEELAKSRDGGQVAQITNQLSPDEIAARKKDIVRSNARKLDFFRKAAQDNGVEKPKDEKNDGDGDEKKKKSDAPVLRDQSGRFASPTDPVAVENAEKTAEGIFDMLANPKRTAKELWHSATFKPLALMGGGLASVYIASKIVDAVNKRRRESSKSRVDSERDEYVKLLQEGEEKSAQAKGKVGDNPLYGAAAVLGGSFLVPALLSAIVVNRMMNQKRKEKDKLSQLSDSYPDEPVILYKTSEADEMEITPEAAFAVLTVKSAMFKALEEEDRELGGKVEKEAESMSDVDAVNQTLDMFDDPANASHVLNISKAYSSGDTESAGNAFMNMFKAQKNLKDPNGLGKALMRPHVRRAILAHPRLTNRLFTYYTDPKWKETFGGHADEMLGNELSKSFKKDSFLYNIVKWLYSTFGFGKDKVKERIGGMLQSAAKQQGAEVQQ